MSDFDWRKLAPDADYPTLNDRLKGLPDYLRKQEIKAPEDDFSYRTSLISSFPGIAKLLGAGDEEIAGAKKWREDWDTQRLAEQAKNLKEKKGLGNAVAATSGLVGGATLGASDALAKRVGAPGAYETMQQVKKDYPVAHTLGNVAGAVGSSLLIPGAGTALAAKGGAIAGKGLLPLLGRAALNTATTAVPYSVMQGVETGDVGKSLKGLGTNMFWGTVGGAAAEKLFSAIPKLARAAKNVSTDMVNASAGVNARGLKSVAAGGRLGSKGATAEHIRELKSALADMITKNKLAGKEVIEDFVQGSGKLWDKVDDVFRASGAKPSQFLDDVMADPHIQTLLNDPVYGKAVGDEIRKILMRGDSIVELAAKTAKVNPMFEIRKMLMDSIKASLKGGDDMTRLTGDVAEVVRDVIDAKFVPEELKAAWPALKLLQQATARQEASISPLIRAGSDTAPRLFLKNMLKGGAAGGGVGAIQGAREIDPNDPTSYLRAAGKMGLYTVGGALANSAFSRLGNRVTGTAAGALRNIIPTVSPALAEGLNQAGPKVGELLSKTIGAGGFGGQAEDGETAEQPVSAQDQAVTQTEAQTPPEQVAAAREKVNPIYKDRVLAALQNDWNTVFSAYAAPLGLTYDRFVDMVSQVTGGFDDPKKTARILFHDPGERDKFLRDYETALKFGEQDIGAALSYAQNPMRGFFKMQQAPGDENVAYQNLIDYLGGAVGQGKETSEAERKRIEQRIKVIAGMKIPDQKKQALILDLLQRAGLDLKQLAGLGLYGGENA